MGHSLQAEKWLIAQTAAGMPRVMPAVHWALARMRSCCAQDLGEALTRGRLSTCAVGASIFARFTDEKSELGKLRAMIIGDKARRAGSRKKMNINELTGKLCNQVEKLFECSIYFKTNKTRDWRRLQRFCCSEGAPGFSSQDPHHQAHSDP